MSLRKRLREAKEKYPGVDVFICRGILYISGIPEDKFTEVSLSSSYFLPKDDFSITYELGDPPELIQKKGMMNVEALVEEKKRERG